MEFKKKTIIWEDNNEPPKDYIWAKKDGKFYEYSYTTRSWVESKLIKTEESGGSDDGGSDSGSFLMNLIPNNYPKPDLFLCTKTEEGNVVKIDVTNYEIDDLLSLIDGEIPEIPITCLYESSNLDKPIITDVRVSFGEIIITFFGPNDEKNVTNDAVVYNNKTYYQYYQQNSARIF